ncbi:MAG TPA: tRNA lysidine(34) synthetase TilS [Chthoniobacterales bacterium]
MDDIFLSKLAATTSSWPAARRMIVGVSGGRDSMALFHGLHALGRRGFIVAHLDHGLRGRASAADANFVRRAADRLGCPYILGRADVRGYAGGRGISIEHAAREMRHLFFAGVARRERCRTVVLAHHADDQIETCLFNFLRGSGAAGLAGMRSQSVHRIGSVEMKFLRPMLAIRRAEINAWMQANKLRWREDASNRSAEYTRNRIRERVLPVLAGEFGTAFPEAILRSAEIFAAEDDWMQAEAEKLATGPELSVAVLIAAPLALRRRAVRRWLKVCGIEEPGFAEVERVLSLLDTVGGPAKVNLPGDRHARRRQGKLFVE